LAREEGITVIEEDISLYDAYNADEMSLTSTGLCLCGVRTINGVTIGDGSPPGEITKRLTDAYVRFVDFDFVKQYLDRLAA
jgi:branched-chain amino acid aminotransferase